MSSIGAVPPGELEKYVIDTVAAVTRYPRDILQPGADFEDDLGIDSVKRAEILAALRKPLGLPKVDAALFPKIRTIGDAVATIRAMMGEGAPAHPVPAVPSAPVVMAAATPAPAAVASSAVPADLERYVVDVIATVTRYPRDILQPTAAFEDDLGIDSVKRAEILAALRKPLGLPKVDAALFPQIRTIGDAVTTLRSMLAQAGAPAPAVIAGPSPARNGAPAPATVAEHASFAGKVVLVTGSGHGIGRTIAEHFAARGARVIVNSFHSRERGDETEQAIRAAGGEAHHIWGSVAQPDHLARIFAEIDAQFGGLDVYVANASNGIIGPIAEITPDHWDRAFRTNIIGLHQGSLMAAPLMMKRGGGRIVALSSPMAHRCAEHFACIGPVKAAVESLVRYLAVEMAPHNIQVNTVSASAVAGELVEQKIPDRERLVPYWQSLVGQRRLVTAEEVAAMVAYVCGQAAAMITGTTLVVDGGMALKI